MNAEEHLAFSACRRLAEAGHLHTHVADPRLIAMLPAVQRGEVEEANRKAIAEQQEIGVRGHAAKIARLRHELWNYERQSAPTFEAQRERDHRCEQFRAELVQLGATPTGARSK